MRHLLVFIGFMFSAHAASANLPSPEWNALNKNNETSTAVIRVSDGKVLFESHPDKLLSTASVTKLATSITALKKFTPHHKFRTEFFYTGTRSGNKINGDLIVKGGGDPLLVSEKLWQVAADIKNMGIQVFTGNIIIDNSLFIDEGRDDSRKAYAAVSENAYDAPLSALGINFNTVAVNIAPNTAAGMPALLSIDPYPIDKINFQNSAKTSNKGEKISIVRQMNGEDMQISARGNIGLNDPLKKLYRSVENTTLINGEYIRAFFNAAGVQINGEVKSGTVPGTAKKLIVVEGYPLSYIIHGLNKYSNNYIADMLVKDLGAIYGGRGDMKSGINQITAFLNKELLFKNQFQLHNGSGLDPKNKFTAKQISQLLHYAAQNMDIYPELIASLAVAGEDGTLERRFTTPDTRQMQGKLRAKTGTLTSPRLTSSLAGYYNHPKHGLLAFSLICNAKENTNLTMSDQRQTLDTAITKILVGL